MTAARRDKDEGWMERIGMNATPAGATRQRCGRDLESKAVKETVTARGLRPFTCRDRQAILFS
jgi:hypothetical protein